MNLSEMQINNIVNESIRKMLPEKNHTKWIEIKHFHPEGLVFPNGSHYLREGTSENAKKTLTVSCLMKACMISNTECLIIEAA